VIDSSRRRWISLALVGVAVVWGSTFVMVMDAVEGYPLYAFLGWRFAIAVVAFLVIFPKALRRLTPGAVGVGVLAGAILTAGYVFQTWGLQITSASKAAFITGMFVVITPLLQAVFLRRPPKAITMFGVALAVSGLWLLSGSSGGGWNMGDTAMILCATAYASHMIVLGGLGREHDAAALTLVQLVTVAVVCGAVSFARKESAAVPAGTSLWTALLVTGVLASAVAFWIQTTAQRYISPTKTALILIMEPAFGGLFGWLAGEALGLRGLAGAMLILAGMVIAELLGAAPLGRGEHVVYDPSIEAMPVPIVEQLNSTVESDL
jgi:drug/metabolite transporter (DMT)-like permease